MEPKINDVWIHRKTGNQYYIDGLSHLKTRRGWVLAVTYSNYVGCKTFTREMDDFLEKFERAPT